MKISIIGIGFVGGAMLTSFKNKSINVVAYDKYKKLDKFEDCLDSDICFLCLPTQYNENIKKYDKSIIYQVSSQLNSYKYNGLIVIKSTIEPGTTHDLENKFPLLKFIHNPEFLSAATAFEDFDRQSHIVLGKGDNVTDEHLKDLYNFYSTYYINAEISVCSCLESESMKIFCNCFYAVKLQFFNELYDMCDKNGSNYNNIIKLMLKNKWINPMHTTVPGPDGKLSYGGLCFPKDTNALLNHMKENNVKCKILDACIQERNEMRDDNENIINLKNNCLDNNQPNGMK
jgi:UDPglucose 6-dehydrogenase